MAGQKKEYLWNKKTDKELLLMPETCVEHFLANPTMPTNLDKARKGAIKSPDGVSVDILGERGLLSASMSIHRKGFYLSRDGVDFHLVIFTISGEAELSVNGKKSAIKKGSIFIAPAGTSFEYVAKQDWRVFWFHVADMGVWNAYFPSMPILKKSKFASKLEMAMRLYLEEAYAKDKSLKLLEAYADMMVEFLRRDLGKYTVKKNPEEILEETLSKISSRPNAAWNAETVAKELKVSKTKLHRICMKNYSMGIMKLILKKRMLCAKNLISDSSLTNAKIAEKLGYANAFSFSKAYKNFWGTSPRSS